MSKDFIPYQEALELKELGFDEPCFGWFTDSYLRIGFVESKHVQGEDETLAPTYSQAFRWFREKYGLYHSIGLDNSLEDDVNCDYQIINHSQSISESETDFKTYEEAELECLKKLIEIVKENKQ
jgi:hypothetical protein